VLDIDEYAEIQPQGKLNNAKKEEDSDLLKKIKILAFKAKYSRRKLPKSHSSQNFTKVA